jgi:hypothetical protein
MPLTERIRKALSRAVQGLRKVASGQKPGGGGSGPEAGGDRGGDFQKDAKERPTSIQGQAPDLTKLGYNAIFDALDRKLRSADVESGSGVETRVGPRGLSDPAGVGKPMAQPGDSGGRANGLDNMILTSSQMEAIANSPPKERGPPPYQPNPAPGQTQGAPPPGGLSPPPSYGDAPPGGLSPPPRRRPAQSQTQGAPTTGQVGQGAVAADDSRDSQSLAVRLSAFGPDLPRRRPRTADQPPRAQTSVTGDSPSRSNSLKH